MEREELSELLVLESFYHSPLSYLRVNEAKDRYYAFEVTGFRVSDEFLDCEFENPALLNYKSLMGEIMNEEEFRQHF